MRNRTPETEVKSFSLKLDAPPDSEGRFSGYAAVFGNVDKGNDVIEKGAFTKTLQENPEVPILWSHDTDEPIGVSTYMVEDGKGLKVEGQLAMEVQRAREVHALMNLGAIKGISIGYNTVKRSFKGQVRHLQELALGEFSPVVFPMNPLAAVEGVKAAAEDMKAHLAALTDIATSGDPDYVATMREPIGDAIKTLTALLETEPAEATQDVKAAAEQDDVEPDVSTLRALIADVKSA